MNSEQALRILGQHVETERLFGVDAVPVGPLRPWPWGAREPAPGGKTVAPLEAEPEDAAAKARRLQVIDTEEVRGCTRCGLHRGRMNTVFGEGDPDAELMFVGEGPGSTEDEQGRPFVGPAGELLDRMIAAMGLTREAVYIANVVKCRPPNNRIPSASEVSACRDYLRRQVAIVRPRVIVSLGGPAAKELAGTGEGITRLRGKWQRYRGLEPEGPAIPLMPTFHPAYLLRAYTRENRARVWSDLQAALEKMREGEG